MKELDDNSVNLIITSPPYYNAPFDYPGLFADFEEFKDLIKKSALEMKRVLKDGRIVSLVVDDILVDGKRFPVVAEITNIFTELDFKYRDKIVWIKPEGYIRISRRSGVLLQHPYPMYYYPDNLQESILIFQNGNFDYKEINERTREISEIDIDKYQNEKWYLNVWNITNILPNNNRLEKGIAAFPDEIPYRLIKLFSYKGEIVLDPFMGSGTTLKVADKLDRKCVGYEIDKELIGIVKMKLGLEFPLIDDNGDFELIIRDDTRKLRTKLLNRVEEKIEGG
jgi:DNA modification methylase